MNTPSVTDEEQSAAFLAWKCGEPVEWWSIASGSWVELTPPYRMQSDIIIRRKPAPKLRAWKADEAPLGAWYLHESGGLPWLADKLYLAGVCFAGNETLFSYEQLARQFRYTIDGGKNWLPCGVEKTP